MEMKENYEIIYLRNVCDIQSAFIDEKISKDEYKQKMEIERLKYISYLEEQNTKLFSLLRQEKMDDLILKNLKK